MKITRREFVKGSVVAGTAVAVGGAGILVKPRVAHAFAQSQALAKFIQPFRNVGGDALTAPAGIPVALSDGAAPVTGVTHYTLNIGQFEDRLHPFLPKPTALWGFNPTIALNVIGTPAPTHLGGIIVAQKGVPIQITFQNNLNVLRHIIPVDTTLPGANQAIDRIAVHLHGGFVPWISDGGPFDWFDPAGGHGLSFLNNQVLNPGALAGQAEYYYPMDQSARLTWYHDHAIGITRINAYAGIASALVIRDSFEAGLVGAAPGKGLPAFVENGGFELPIVIQDKIFVDTNIFTVDPTWNLVSPGQPGDLWYAHVYDPTRWRLFKGGATLLPPDPSAIPEFFGDTMLANGTVYPEVQVQARRYRLRILNACNARFLNLQLYVDAGVGTDGITLNPKTLIPTNAPYNPSTAAGVNLAPFSCRVIGTEGGFLPKPVNVPLNIPFNPVLFNGSLLLAPAERTDVIIDFTGYDGQKLILYNDAPAPFPIGDPRNDYFPGAPKNPTITTPGFGPNTRQIMRFSVIPAQGPIDPPLTITTASDLTAGNDTLLAPVTAPGGVPIVPAPNRSLTLNEDFDQYGRLIQRLGTNVPLVKGTFARNYLDPATETPAVGATEVWQIANLTGDTHPIHFHLVNVQTIARQPFNVKNYNGVPNFNGPARPPDPEEEGWKETVRMNPGEVTTVKMKFTLPVVPFAVPASPRTTGNEYVWHCHILEHEEHDMMRPLVVSGVNPTSGVTPEFQAIWGAVGGSVSFTIYGGTPAYSVTPGTFGATILGSTFTVTVPAGTGPQTVIYTIKDSLNATIGTATLRIA